MSILNIYIFPHCKYLTVTCFFKEKEHVEIIPQLLSAELVLNWEYSFITTYVCVFYNVEHSQKIC